MKKMKEIEIEKVFRVKGFDKCFKTGVEAAHYAKNELAKDCLRQIKNDRWALKCHARKIEQIRKMIGETKLGDDELCGRWELRHSGGDTKIYSKRADVSASIAFYVDTMEKSDLRFFRELVKYNGKKIIRQLEEAIRRLKASIKESNRRYDAVRRNF